jgi:hypothetical protein
MHHNPYEYCSSDVPTLYVRPMEKYELKLVTSTCIVSCNVLLQDCTRHNIFTSHSVKIRIPGRPNQGMPRNRGWAANPNTSDSRRPFIVPRFPLNFTVVNTSFGPRGAFSTGYLSTFKPLKPYMINTRPTRKALFH